MCGIAGIFGQGASEHLKVVERMIAAMAHRGPDDERTYVSPTGDCVLGHRRLAILDLSVAAAQPMVSKSGRWAFVYNGECYNYQELGEDLCAQGQRLRTSGDTEVVMRLLSQDGLGKTLPRLNGMFALALWDQRKQRLVLARDRYGQKPLYFARVGKLLLFASEVRALLVSGLVARQADPDAVCGYLSYGAIPESRTIVSGISLLRPATSITFEPNGGEKTDTYWMPPTEKDDVSPAALQESFFSAVRRHLVSDAPLGLFLSGGIDSSAVVIAAAKSTGLRAKTLTVVFPEDSEHSEAQFAAAIARKAGTDHTEVPVTAGEMLRMLPKALDAMDQPTGNGINTYIVAQAARQAGLKVALSGLGGDELFGGYASFAEVPQLLRLRRLLAALRRPGANLLGAYWPFITKQAKLADLLDAPLGVLFSYLTSRRVFTSRQIRKIAPRLVQQGWESGLDASFYRLLGKAGEGRAVQDAIGLFELRNYMGQTLLRDSDVMGMAHGLEIRIPFLDSDFSSVALMLEAGVRTPRSRTKWRFIEAMGNHLPGDILRRPKQGFTLPFKDWMLGELKDEVPRGLRALGASYPAIQQEVLFRLWDSFIAQPERIGWYRPWTLFVLGSYLSKHRLEVPS